MERRPTQKRRPLDTIRRYYTAGSYAAVINNMRLLADTLERGALNWALIGVTSKAGPHRGTEQANTVELSVRKQP